jgi:hypothetical protein
VKPRSTLAEMILPMRGLYRQQAQTSPRAARRRAWLYLAAASPGLAAVVHVTAPKVLAVDVLALALLLGASWLLGEGLKAEDDFRARASARAPRLPLKTLAALLTGAGVAACFAGAGSLSMLVYGLTATGLHLVAFGIDPLHHKTAEGDDLAAAGRIEPHLATARTHLAEIERVLYGLGDRELALEGRAFAGEVNRLLALVARRPAALPQVRGHLGVLLKGARDATLRLADVWPGQTRGEVREEYLWFLSDLKSSYADRTRTLETAIKQEMTLEMDVVRDRLKRRGPLDSEE